VSGDKIHAENIRICYNMSKTISDQSLLWICNSSIHHVLAKNVFLFFFFSFRLLKNTPMNILEELQSRITHECNH
jgi:hypothetical protein